MKIKTWDYIIIGIFIVISFLPALFFAARSAPAAEGVYAVIQVQGQEYRRVELTGHTGRDEIIIRTELGINIIEVVDERIGMYEADCPDKVCYIPEFIGRPGETIVCLPNRVVIEVKGNVVDVDQEDIITG